MSAGQNPKGSSRGSWLLKLPETMSSGDVHVYPLHDLKEHITDGPGCPCEPTIKVEGAALIYVHNSWDHREIVEEAVNIMNEDEVLPTEEGKKRYEPNGYWEDAVPCTCKPDCATSCRGECGCSACSQAYHDAIDWD